MIGRPARRDHIQFLHCALVILNHCSTTPGGLTTGEIARRIHQKPSNKELRRVLRDCERLCKEGLLTRSRRSAGPGNPWRYKLNPDYASLVMEMFPEGEEE